MAISEKPGKETRLLIEDNGLIIMDVTRIILDDDGSFLTRVNKRSLLEPGDDVSTQPNKIKQITQIVWTQQVIDAYRALKAQRLP